jgi:dTDP-4-dehydrorhamnose reductase
MKILLLGANGQLGTSFLQTGALARQGELVVASRTGQPVGGQRAEMIDLADPDTIPPALNAIRPDVIVNAAAYTAVDRAESEEALARTINGEAVRQLGEWAADRGALIVHFSTDYVFDGRRPESYAVETETSPVNAYGRSKLAGEIALRESGAAHMIFRTAWLYANHGQNFMRTMLRLASERDELRIVADQHGSPTPTDLVAKASGAALSRWRDESAGGRRNIEGNYHLVAGGQTTWYDFAEAIFDEAVERRIIPRKPRLVPLTTAEYPTAALRPFNSVLDNSRFAKVFAYPLPGWRSALAVTMDTFS